MLELDGIARRILLCPPDLRPEHVPGVIADGEVEAIVSDPVGPAFPLPEGMQVVCIRPAPVRTARGAADRLETEWVLFTSGTTGRPKLVVHRLASLTGPLADGPVAVSDAVWSTFYDIRRYGGLQVLLRALLGGVSLVLADAEEPLHDFLTRAGRHGVTHMLGTPTHWRRALMSPALARIAPRYVRLSGEVADQAILDQLARAFPGAELTHAYASTEAGVGFEVRDGREGFPASCVGCREGGLEVRVEGGSLRIRSARMASRYLGDGRRLAGPDGFIDTGDMVVRRGERYYFAGRREGVINVGGQKVHPEEVEAVLTRHPAVRMAQVRGRRSPITGTIVVADVVVAADAPTERFESMEAEILAACRAALPAYKVPAIIRRVDALEMSASGKLGRAGA